MDDLDLKGRGRLLRSILGRILALNLDDPDVKTELETLKKLAAQYTGLAPVKRGNPDMVTIRLKANLVRKSNANAKKAEVAIHIRALRKQGKYTYRELAEGLNAIGIDPPVARKWSAGSVHSYDPDK